MTPSLRFLATLTTTLAIVVAAESAGAQTPAETPKCSSDSVFHVLDFWVGDWNVVDSTGAKLGTNRIEKILDGCAIAESWRETDGEGRSLFYYVPSQRLWKQVWVTPQTLVPGGVKEKHLIAQSKETVRFQGEIVGPRGGRVIDRTTLSTMSGGRVRQVIEISRDGGTTWRTTFDGIYVRATKP